MDRWSAHGSDPLLKVVAAIALAIIVALVWMIQNRRAHAAGFLDLM
jgi:hypothetical protein